MIIYFLREFQNFIFIIINFILIKIMKNIKKKWKFDSH